MKLEHISHFDLPRPQGADERFGFGLAALALTPRGTLWASGKVTRGLVAEISIPEPGGTAEIITPWFDPAGDKRGEMPGARLDRLGGLLERDGGLWSLHYTYYGTGDIDALDVPTLVHYGIESSTGFRIAHGPWHIGPDAHPFHQKNTSHWLFESPPGRVYCGRGDGAGNATAPRGPALFHFHLSNPEVAEVLLYRDAEHAPSWWSPVDKWTGAAWLTVGTTQRVAFVGSKDMTLRSWYGTDDEVDPAHDEAPPWFTPAYAGLDALAWNNEAEWREVWEEMGIVDEWYKSKGYHTEDRAVVLQLYDPAELGPGRYPEPEGIALEGFHPASQVAGMAYDHAAQRLYIGEVYPPKNMDGMQAGEHPRIHVFAVSLEASEPLPPPGGEEDPGIESEPEWEEGQAYVTVQSRDGSWSGWLPQNA